ncbi:MAG: 30S ribosomal protein S21 [Calditrichaeota bacterium]|nr:MAG: 30S ribosomal protein S21 [Calditrichota bacterium]
MLSVKVKDNESFEKTLRRFTTECNKNKVVRGYRERSFYVSPSERMHEIRMKKKRYGVSEPK